MPMPKGRPLAADGCYARPMALWAHVGPNGPLCLRSYHSSHATSVAKLQLAAGNAATLVVACRAWWARTALTGLHAAAAYKW